VIPTVVSGLLWTWILNVQYGVLNYLLSSFHLQSSFHAWLSDPALAMFTVIGVTTWKWYPFDMLMLLAALQTVPKDLLEAAAVDGAGAIRRFRHIVIPRLWNVMLSVMLLSLIWSFQEFTMIWTTTKGGPLNLTSTVGIKIYRTAFEFFHLGSAAAMGTMWFIVVLVISAIAIAVFQQRDVTA
jgi:multiple sugar transport system permease protein